MILCIKRFRTFRQKLHAYLGASVRGYSVVREPAWDRKLSAHITFGYFVNPLQDSEIDVLLDFVTEFNQGVEALHFPLSQGEVTLFRDMDHYEVIAKG